MCVTKGKSLGVMGSKGYAVMARMEDHSTDLDDTSTETTIRFVLTLIVTTAMVGLAAYVLSFAVLGPGWSGPAHRAAISTVHVHS
jgi:hypothetical protein